MGNNAYVETGATSEFFVLANNTRANLNTNFTACKLGITTDTGSKRLFFKDDANGAHDVACADTGGLTAFGNDLASTPSWDTGDKIGTITLTNLRGSDHCNLSIGTGWSNPFIAANAYLSSGSVWKCVANNAGTPAAIIFDDGDVKFKASWNGGSPAAGASITWLTPLTISKYGTSLFCPDNVVLGLGNSSGAPDIKIYSDGTNGRFLTGLKNVSVGDTSCSVGELVVSSTNPSSGAVTYVAVYQRVA